MKNVTVLTIMLTAIPQFVTDTITLANDASTWLIAVSAVVASFLAGWFGFKWYRADENEKPAAAKRVKGVVIGAVGVVLAEAIIKLVLSYYTH